MPLPNALPMVVPPVLPPELSGANPYASLGMLGGMAGLGMPNMGVMPGAHFRVPGIVAGWVSSCCTCCRLCFPRAGPLPGLRLWRACSGVVPGMLGDMSGLGMPGMGVPGAHFCGPCHAICGWIR